MNSNDGTRNRENKPEWSDDRVCCLVTICLKYYTPGKQSRCNWDAVMEEIYNIKPDFSFDRVKCQKKFSSFLKKYEENRENNAKGLGSADKKMLEKCYKIFDDVLGKKVIENSSSANQPSTSQDYRRTISQDDEEIQNTLSEAKQSKIKDDILEFLKNHASQLELWHKEISREREKIDLLRKNLLNRH